MSVNKNEGDRSNFIKQMLEVEVFPNLATQVIVTTEDRLRLRLSEYFDKVKKKNDWIAPASLLFTIVTVFVTADFKEFILSAEVWKAIFIVSAVICLVWLVVAIKNSTNIIKLETVIQQIKADNKS